MSIRSRIESLLSDNEEQRYQVSIKKLQQEIRELDNEIARMTLENRKKKSALHARLNHPALEKAFFS